MKVLLADRRSDVRSALRLLLEQNPDIIVIGEASRADELLAMAETGPDLVLCDCELANDGTMNLLKSLRSLCGRTAFIVLSSRSEQREQVLAAGADYFVSKADAPETLRGILDSLLKKSERTNRGATWKA